MGLNIYFCDICGVRVTDVDLRSGHGLLRGHQVMCGTCVGMGHGKAWLASSTAPSAQSHPLIDAGRDRAMTEPDPVLPVPPRQDTHETVRVPTVAGGGDLAAVAQSLGAMTAPSAASAASMTEDIVENDPQRDSAELPATAYQPPANAEDSSALQPAVRRSAHPQSSSSSRRVASAGGRSSGSRSGSAVVRSSSTRQVKPKTARAAAASPKSRGMPLPVVVTLVGLCLIGGVTWYLVGHHGGSAKVQVVDLKDARDALGESIKTARTVMNQALESQDVAQLKAARETFRKAQEEARRFEQQATEAGWTDENIEVQLEAFRFEDLQGKDTLVRQELAKRNGL